MKKGNLEICQSNFAKMEWKGSPVHEANALQGGQGRIGPTLGSNVCSLSLHFLRDTVMYTINT
jgi:hypothetical protein